MSLVHEDMTIEEVGIVVCAELAKAGIKVFLSGGAVVSIYTKNQYQSWDLDFISFVSRKKIKEAMENIGFKQDKGRYFTHPATKFFVEFPGSALLIGDEPITEFAERKSSLGVLKLLTPTDCVMDRLCAYYYWNDPQSLDQAVLVAKAHPVNLERIKQWSIKERMEEKCKEFLKRLKTKK